MNNAFTNYQLPQQIKAPTYHWQELAIEALKYLEQPKRSVVFKWFKLQESKATTVLRYMQEKNIRSFLYMCKLMNK